MADDRMPAFGASHARSYAEGPPRQVPGFDGLHRMTSQLLAEQVPAEGRVLVLGAGGGLEIRALADDHPGWHFTGVDPSPHMLGAAEAQIAPHRQRVELVEGTIEAAPAGPFDGATCLLTMHFVPAKQRLPTLRAVRERLRPGAPLVMAHISFAQTEPERSLWIRRHIAFGGGDPQAQSAVEAMRTRLIVLPPDAEEALLGEAGFRDVALFYAGLSFRGWIAYA